MFRMQRVRSFMMAPLSRAALAYDRALKRRPLPVKAATSGVLNCCADATLQTIQSYQSGQAAPWDAKRTLTFGTAYGLLWYGPFMHVVTTTWGRILPSTSLGSLAFKSAVDVCTSFPVNLCAVIGLQAAIRGDPPREAVRENLFASWCAGAAFWPGGNMVVYSLPVHYRVATLNLFSYSWNCFMLWSAFDALAADGEERRQNWIEVRLAPAATRAAVLLQGFEGAAGQPTGRESSERSLVRRLSSASAAAATGGR